MKKEKYDVIIPIGAACLNSLYLRSHLLQKISYPLDWVGCYTVETGVDLICSDFKDFLDLSDLFETGRVCVDRMGPCKFVQSRKTGVVFGHDFPDKVEIAKVLPEIKDKYLRRINRLREVIKEKNKVIFIYMEENNPKHLTEDDPIFRAYEKLHKKFPNKQISLLYLSNDLQMKKCDKKDELLSENIRKITFNYHNNEFGDGNWIPDWKSMEKAIGYLRVQKPLGEFLYEKILLGVSHVIIFRSLRRKFLRKCHLYV